ncbi:PREDICTED: RRP15-like protein [Tarenaya hassleriana]|uniref:RRP15-like protein n=1 Tax=Tarenaya hassleriana TaxID=28532 RepID=UPI00053C24C3|nr:PREDICTED: RRP15-like protein [Tarenaya hassleriana]XP_010524633.1 PREDICTED: RRP15-like protein [Tarenaya hassleriana]
MSAGEEAGLSMAERGARKRRVGKKKGGKAKKLKALPGSAEKVKITKKMKKLFQKRARDYNSDDDDNDEVEATNPNVIGGNKFSDDEMEEETGDSSGDEEKVNGKDKGSGDEDSEDGENEEIQRGITRLAEGCKGFRIAFRAIMKKGKEDDTLGPILSAKKHLVAKKLAEEEAERKVKGQAKREKHLVAEKGHVKPANYLDSHEKFLIGVATKGVVKLFNAVNKAQHAQKGLNLSRSKDIKVIRKRRKEAFFSELGKPSRAEVEAKAKAKSPNSIGDEAPAWAPLRDNYMLANPKLKDWDKKQDIPS